MENPDRKNETSLQLRPFLGALRYLNTKAGKRQLQQFQYSASGNKDDWYDVPSVWESDLPVVEEPVADESDDKPAPKPERVDREVPYISDEEDVALHEDPVA